MAEKKFSPMRYTASTEAAAVAGALSVVGVSHDEIDYEVIESSAKGVTVRIKPRSVEAPIAEPTVIETPVEEPVAEAAPMVDESPIVEDVPELLAQDDEIEDADADEEIVLDSPAVLAFDEPPTTEAVQDFIENGDESDGAIGDDEADVEAEPIEAATPLDPALVAQAQSLAQQFLDKMGLEAQVRATPNAEPNTAGLVIEGADVGILIGKHGATLQSFQYLLNLTLNSHLEGDGMRVAVDAGNYRARRQSSLEQIARGAAAKARRDARSVRLDPMPAHERRLVHMYLQTEADVFTQSEGREPLRRIVISPSMGAPTGQSSALPAAPRENVERSTSNDRPGESRGGMGSFRRSGGNSGGQSGGRGFNRGR